ncbi:site-specific DNA-methyltransferase [Patulibacter sp. S7RM1-6]
MSADAEPEPLPATTQAQQDQLLALLRDQVPEAFADGVLDPDALLSHLGVVPVPEGAETGYEFGWSGLTRARVEATTPTTASLRPDEAASVAWGETGNVAIEGDNLQILKTLLNGYRGKFKLIYIDPPYNTGSTFTYSDKFAIAEAEWLQQTGQVDEDGNALTSKIENGGRKHAPWLTMMLPRLIVARHLLRRDGAIVAAIDDNEVHHLRMLMDAVFGEANFTGSFVWEGGRKNDARFVSVGHDYMLTYARDKAHLVAEDVRWQVRKVGLEELYAEVARLRTLHEENFTTIQTELRGWYDGLKKGHPSLTNRHYRFVDGRGIYYPDNLRSPNPRANLVYDYKGYKPHANGWAVDRESMERLDSEDRLVFPEDPEGRIAVKRYLHEGEAQTPGSVFYRDRRGARQALEELMGSERVFDFPKDTSVLVWLLEALTADGDLVLDFFAGSGSTAQAVWERNRIDGGRRRWVMVQAPEPPEKKKDAPENPYATVSELMFDRLRKASDEMATATAGADEDLGFRVFRIGESNLREEPPIVTDGTLGGDEYIQQALAIHGAPTFVEGSNPDDVRWEVLLKGTRFDLSSQMVDGTVGELRFTDVRQHGGGDGPRTVICLADTIGLDDFEALGLDVTDTLICVKDAMVDGTAVTVGQRCKLLVIERVRSAVSL